MVRRHVGGRLARGGGLPGQGQDRLRRGAGRRDRHLGWLYAWSWGIQKPARRRTTPGSSSPGRPVKEYEELVGEELGWSKVPAGKRASTYENADYLKEAGAVRRADQAAIETADPKNPGVQPRPAPGIQFIDIPEFPDLGTQVSQDVSSAIAGQMSVDEALDKGQGLAEDVADRYQPLEQ